MAWEISIKKKLQKSILRLPKQVRKNFKALLKDIELHGPARGECPNFSPLSGNQYHCHLKKGHLTYVAVWEVRDKTVKLIRGDLCRNS